MFKNDAVFFDKLNSRAVSILNPATGHGVEVGFPGFETVAFWTLYPEPAPYLCVEPGTAPASMRMRTTSSPIGTTYSVSVQGTAAAIS